MNLALLIGTGLLVLAVLTELACRMWLRHGARVYIWPPHLHVEMDLDPNVLPNLPSHARFQANRLGARGDEPPRKGKVYRVLTCGGSAVECFSIDQTLSWSHRVQEILNRPANRARLGVEQVHVDNIGKSGFTTDALCYTLPRVLPRFAPLDVLTFMIGTSAVNSWTSVGTPSILPPADVPWLDIAWHAERPRSWRPKQTATAELLRRWRQWLRRPVTVRKGAGRRLAQTRTMRQTAREMRDRFGDPTQWLQHFEESLARAVELSRPFAQRLVLIRQPWFDKPEPTPEEEALFWHGSVGDADAGFADIFYSHRVLCALMQMIDDATTRVGARLGVEVCCPAEVLQASAQTYYDHFHFTAAGARVVGDYIGQQILDADVRCLAVPSRPVVAVGRLS